MNPSDKEKIRLVLKKRKGFIKLALRYGVNLVPTFSFGEAFIYGQVAINIERRTLGPPQILKERLKKVHFQVKKQDQKKSFKFLNLPIYGLN